MKNFTEIKFIGDMTEKRLRFFSQRHANAIAVMHHKLARALARVRTLK